ncbi:MAG: hypothetical protein AB7G06_08160 [Bdellovibrionales bacterium]
MPFLFLPFDVPVWIGALSLLALAGTALYDARTGLVPPVPLAVATLLLMFGLISVDAARAFTAPLYAVLFYAGVWAVNEAHYRITGRDALGLGDAHWSLVAVMAYGPLPVLMAWGAGAWLAIFWLGGLKLLKRPAGHVYFVPFLFAGLMLVLMLLPVLATAV